MLYFVDLILSISILDQSPLLIRMELKIGQNNKGIKSKFMIEQVRVLTSVSSENKSIVDLCDQLNVQCFQGHENNVASRYKEIIEADQ